MRDSNYRELVEHAEDGIFTISAEGQFLFANKKFLQMMGYTQEECLHRNILDTYPDDIRPDGLDRLAQLRSGEALRFERSMKRLDGGIVFVDAHAWKNDDGNMQAIVRDMTERRHKDEALRLAHERLRRFVDSNIVGILVANAAGDVLEANDYYLRLIGFTRAELEQGKIDWRAITPPEWLPKDEQAIRELRERGTCVPYEKEYLRRDGTRVPVLLADTLLPGPEDQIAAFALDLTDRKQAEGALRASEVRYRRLFEAAKDGVLILDAETGMVEDVNPFLEQLLGFSHEALLGKRIWELGFFKDIMANRAHFEELLQREYIRYDDKPLEAADGRRIAVEFVSNVYRANHHKVIQCNIRDITERKRAEAALRQSEEFKEAIFDSVASHIAVLDSAGVIVAVNSPWQRFAGENLTSTGEPAHNCGIGVNYLEVCRRCIGESAEGAMAAHDGIQAVLAGREPSFTLEYPCHSPNEQRWFTMMVTPLGRAGRGVVVSHANITERKRTEVALRKLSLQLNRAEEAERRRIARELHDSTGQKLAALSMTVGLIQDATGAPASKTEQMFADCLATIEQCAQEIRTLSYLLHPPLLDELGLAAAIRDYAGGFSKRDSIKVTFDAPPGLERLPDEVELALFRIVQESLGNIHRHAGASSARIRLACDAEQVTMEVSDRGRGMSAETLRSIEAGRGSAGVGIAGMRERLRLLGGRLEIKSGERGVTVRAIIPRRPELT